MYVADTSNNRIREVSQGGNVTTTAGNGTKGNLDGTGATAEFLSPGGLAIGSSGTVYVANQVNIRMIEPINPSKSRNAFHRGRGSRTGFAGLP